MIDVSLINFLLVVTPISSWMSQIISLKDIVERISLEERVVNNNAATKIISPALKISCTIVALLPHRHLFDG